MRVQQSDAELPFQRALAQVPQTAEEPSPRDDSGSQIELKHYTTARPFIRIEQNLQDDQHERQEHRQGPRAVHLVRRVPARVRRGGFPTGQRAIQLSPRPS
jgi:hypothetical protein